MKKNFYIFCILILLSSVFLNSTNHIGFFATGNFLIPGDAKYSDIFGNAFMPQIKGKIGIIKGIYIFGGYSLISSEGQIADMDVEDRIKASQNFLSFGAGITTGQKLLFYLEGGATIASWEETAFEVTNSGIATGFNVEGGINLKIGKALFLNLNLGYIHAKDNSEEGGHIIPLTLGGLKSGLGLGVCF